MLRENYNLGFYFNTFFTHNYTALYLHPAFLHRIHRQLNTLGVFLKYCSSLASNPVSTERDHHSQYEARQAHTASPGG